LQEHISECQTAKLLNEISFFLLKLIYISCFWLLKYILEAELAVCLQLFQTMEKLRNK